LSCPTISEAAKTAQVSERTLYRWLVNQTFLAELHRQESELINNIARRLVSLADNALRTFQELLDDPQAGSSVRLRAAENVLTHLLRVRELATLEERVSLLEAENTTMKSFQ
jgi:type II secretory pathway predicted ATPase ExeA